MRRPMRPSRIIHRARAYARSGNHLDCRSVEYQLKSEGIEDAHFVLEPGILRHEINDLCAIAHSKEEIARKHAFARWVEKIAMNIIPLVLSEYADSQIRVEEDESEDKLLLMSGKRCEVTLERVFGSSKLRVITAWLDQSESRQEQREVIESVDDFSQVDAHAVAGMISPRYGRHVA